MPSTVPTLQPSLSVDSAGALSQRSGRDTDIVLPYADDDDKASVRSSSTQASTVATTASLASRLAVLNIDFAAEKAEYEGGGLHSVYEGDGQSIHEASDSGYDSEDEEGASGDDRGEDDRHEGEDRERGSRAVSTVDHEEGSLRSEPPMAHMMQHTTHHQDSPAHRIPPFQICSRLFSHKAGQVVMLKRLTIQHCEELKQYGYTIIDNLISKDLASQIKGAALALHRKGRMEEPVRACVSSGVPQDTYPSHDRMTRGEQVLWLSVGRPPADSWPLSALLVVLQEVYEDLAQFVRLRRQGCEYQISVQPAGSLGMSRHRDAAPDGGSLAAHAPSHAHPHSHVAYNLQATTLGATPAQPRYLSHSGSVGSVGTAADRSNQQLPTANGSSGAVEGASPNALSSASALLQPLLTSQGTGNSRRGSLASTSGDDLLSQRGLQGEGLQGSAGAGVSTTDDLHHSGPLCGGVGAEGAQPAVSATVTPAGPSAGPRRLTCMVCCNSDWEKDQGGVVRVWPPRRGPNLGPGHTSLRDRDRERTGRRSLTGSEAGMSQISNEDKSDTFSLRSHYLANFGAASVTSSMWAEIGAHEAETASVDGSSMADGAEERVGLEWQEVEGETVLDVAPLGGRMLLFLSGAVEHAVSPAANDMASVTAWF